VLLVSEIPRGAPGKLQQHGFAALPRLGPDVSGICEYKRAHDPQVHAVAHRLEKKIGSRRIAHTDDSFELDRNLAHSAAKISPVEQVCGYRVPLATLFGGATVEHLGNVLLERKMSVERRSQLVEIQGRGSRPPFVFLHGDYGGGGFYCRKLARFLGEDQPFYA